MLGLPVQELQKKTTTKEFLLWSAYLEEKPNLLDPIHHYLAQIALVISQSNRKKGSKRMLIKDFLITFRRKKTKEEKAKKKEEMSERDKRAAIDRSKQGWLAAVGILGSKEKSKAKGIPSEGVIKRTPPPKKSSIINRK